MGPLLLEVSMDNLSIYLRCIKHFFRNIPIHPISFYNYLRKYFVASYYPECLHRKELVAVRSHPFMKFLENKIKNNEFFLESKKYQLENFNPPLFLKDGIKVRILFTTSSLRHIAGTEVWILELSEYLFK